MCNFQRLLLLVIHLGLAKAQQTVWQTDSALACQSETDSRRDSQTAVQMAVSSAQKMAETTAVQMAPKREKRSGRTMAVQVRE